MELHRIKYSIDTTNSVRLVLSLELELILSVFKLDLTSFGCSRCQMWLYCPPYRKRRSIWVWHWKLL